MYCCLPKSQLNHLQHMIARAVVAALRSSNPHVSALDQRIEYKVISTAYKLLQFSSPRYLRDLIIVQPS